MGNSASVKKGSSSSTGGAQRKTSLGPAGILARGPPPDAVKSSPVSSSTTANRSCAAGKDRGSSQRTAAPGTRGQEVSDHEADTRSHAPAGEHDLAQEGAMLFLSFDRFGLSDPETMEPLLDVRDLIAYLSRQGLLVHLDMRLHPIFTYLVEERKLSVEWLWKFCDKCADDPDYPSADVLLASAADAVVYGGLVEPSSGTTAADRSSGKQGGGYLFGVNRQKGYVSGALSSVVKSGANMIRGATGTGTTSFSSSSSGADTTKSSASSSCSTAASQRGGGGSSSSSSEESPGGHLLVLEERYVAERQLYLTQADFTEMVSPCVAFVRFALRGQHTIKRFAEVRRIVRDVYQVVRTNHGGQNASYIPQLAEDAVPWDQFAISITSTDGQHFSVGDHGNSFAIQSCSKPISFLCALRQFGTRYCSDHVGVEASGRPFNEVCLKKKKRVRTGEQCEIPHNPCINAGAICTMSMVFPEQQEQDRVAKLVKVWRSLSRGLQPGKEYLIARGASLLAAQARAEQNRLQQQNRVVNQPGRAMLENRGGQKGQNAGTTANTSSGEVTAPATPKDFQRSWTRQEADWMEILEQDVSPARSSSAAAKVNKSIASSASGDDENNSSFASPAPKNKTSAGGVTSSTTPNELTSMTISAVSPEARKGMSNERARWLSAGKAALQAVVEEEAKEMGPPLHVTVTDHKDDIEDDVEENSEETLRRDEEERAAMELHVKRCQNSAAIRRIDVAAAVGERGGAGSYPKNIDSCKVLKNGSKTAAEDEKSFSAAGTAEVKPKRHSIVSTSSDAASVGNLYSPSPLGINPRTGEYGVKVAADIFVNRAMYESESLTANGNWCLAHLMVSKNSFPPCFHEKGLVLQEENLQHREGVFMDALRGLTSGKCKNELKGILNGPSDGLGELQRQNTNKASKPPSNSRSIGFKGVSSMSKYMTNGGGRKNSHKTAPETELEPVLADRQTSGVSLSSEDGGSESATARKENMLLLAPVSSTELALKETLETYFQACSIMSNNRLMSTMAATLSNCGRNPITGTACFGRREITQLLPIILTAGMYDYSGQWAFDVGVPAKSGVGGCVFMVIPGVCGISVFSPRLDENGNSVRGVDACTRLAKLLSLNTLSLPQTTEAIFGNFKASLQEEEGHDEVGAMFDSPTSARSEGEDQDPFSLREMNIRHGRDPFYEQMALILHAAMLGDLQLLTKFYKSGVDFSVGDYDDRTPLHVAVAEGHVSVVQFLLFTVTVEEAEKLDRWGQTAADGLHHAPVAAARKLRRVLANKGLHVKSSGEQRGEGEVGGVFLHPQKGKESAVSTQSQMSFSALQEAALLAEAQEYGDLPALNRGAEDTASQMVGHPSLTDEEIPILWSANRDSIEALDDLRQFCTRHGGEKLTLGADYDCRTCLHLAVCGACLGNVRYLLTQARHASTMHEMLTYRDRMGGSVFTDLLRESAKPQEQLPEKQAVWELIKMELETAAGAC
ncbi:unnamed protein product [Amoebophrya sp. A25]|nr:unnamed protein product [Amoebophrya sp. A25]|eukprot:GSA25T00024646001.1